MSFYYFIFVILFFGVNNEIHIPLYYDSPIKTLTHENYLQYLYYNKLQIKLKIGTPKQSIVLNLDSQEYYTFICGSKIQNISHFNEKDSSSYIEKSVSVIPHRGSTYFSDYSLSSDTIKYDNDINDFNFILATSLSGYKPLHCATGVIGLAVSSFDNDIDVDYNFIKESKKKKHIDHLIYSFDFKNNEFIIGNYPHEYNSDYSKDNMKNIYTNAGVQWIIRNNNITIGDKLSDINENIFLRPDSSVNVATYSFKTIFLNIINNIKTDCKSYSFENILNYEYYYCKLPFESKNLPVLSIYNKELNMTFNLTYDDYTIIHDDYIYFNFIFPKNISDNSYWTLGKPFIHKYNPVFNLDSKNIYFYDNVMTHKSYSSKVGIILSILITIIFLFCVLVVYILYKKNYIGFIKPKKRGIELIENEYEYIPEK